MIILSSKIILFFVIIFGLFIIICIISKIECRLCKISTFKLSTAKNDDSVKLVFISDFHDKKYKNDYSEILNKILSINPDYIVLGGDFVDFSVFQGKFNKVKYKNSIKFIENLSEFINDKEKENNYNLKSIYFAFGNHELRLKKRIDNINLVSSYNEFIKCLTDNNIKILDNNTYDLTDNVTISGISLYDGYYKGLLKRKSINKHIDKSLIDKYFKNLDKNKYNIMVFHKPDYCEDFIDYGFDLVLSGHNHGGLINFPIVGPIFSPELKLFPKYNVGLYTYKNKNVIVSSGIGEHFIKIRVNNIPEICDIRIDSNGKDNL